MEQFRKKNLGKVLWKIEEDEEDEEDEAEAEAEKWRRKASPLRGVKRDLVERCTPDLGQRYTSEAAAWALIKGLGLHDQEAAHAMNMSLYALIDGPTFTQEDAPGFVQFVSRPILPSHAELQNNCSPDLQGLRFLSALGR
ncbi:hypothetical protein GTR04_4267 [Trichophyton interdigitale]|nr:hypothetical protein GY631_6296 [Trichophyton interdigitale]KAG5218470.1 hypothetical protein GY632_5516 [Trichophyton interdigitale]KAG8208344.1 hypothetical protein GTR04_4267 [Trichophyton interdigitale]